MDTARDWTWVPAYTDPCREDRFFADWTGPAGERGFTLDPKTFHRAGPMAFYFGTRKLGDPQYRGTGRKALLLDHLAAHAPDKMTVRLSHRPPGQIPDRVHGRPPGGGRGRRAGGPGGWSRGSSATRAAGPSPTGIPSSGSCWTHEPAEHPAGVQADSGGPTDRTVLHRRGPNLVRDGGPAMGRPARKSGHRAPDAN